MCASWIPHSQDFRRFLRKFGIGNENLYELFTGILPTATVYRSWQDDEIDQWGITVVTDTQGPNRVPAVGVLPSPLRDVLIEQIDVIAYPQSGITNAAISRQSVALYTPQAGYNAIPPANITTAPLPGLINQRNLALPQCSFVGGWNAALPPITGFNPAVYVLEAELSQLVAGWAPAALCNIPIGTAPCPANGGLVANGVVLLASQAAFEIAVRTRIWDAQQPYFRVPAGGALVIQLGQIPSVRYVLAVTLLFHETNAEEI